MVKLLDALLALGCFALISAFWLAAIGLSTTVLMQMQYAFNPLALSSWKTLYLGFLQGGAVPLGFLLLVLAAALLTAAGEIAILWRLPRIVAAMPSPAFPRLSLPHPMKRSARTAKPRAEPAMPSPPAATPPLAEPPPSAETPPPPRPEPPTSLGQLSDSAVLARILALFEVWNEPPPAWMAEALRDEVILLSPDAWPTLESLGSQGLDLLVTLQAHGMMPESPAARRAIGEVETILRAGVAAALGLPETAPPAPALTLAAAWLCEALDNFLAAQADTKTPPDRQAMARLMIEQAMRGMTEQDWTSLDQFPEKAGRIRVLTDRLREDLRRPASARPAAPAETPLEAVIALLKQFDFALDSGPTAARQTPLLAERDDLQLLLQVVDLKGTAWRLPEGPLGPWISDHAAPGFSPGRQLWQQLARRRLRRVDPRPLTGLLILHDGQIEREGLLADLAERERYRGGIGVVWLSGGTGALPLLQQELADIAGRDAGERRAAQRSADHSAAP
jgi:hypothetical protein